MGNLVSLAQRVCEQVNQLDQVWQVKNNVVVNRMFRFIRTCFIRLKFAIAASRYFLEKLHFDYLDLGTLPA
jgi:hypothetical protein